MSSTIYDMLIIGGGPAGLTAAIYAGRAQLKVGMLERMMVGGEVAGTEWVENYPGFDEGVAGIELMQRMEKQAKRFGLEIRSANVDEIDLISNPIRILAQGQEFLTKTVVFATGTDPKLLGIPGEKEFKGRGVSYCATCDGPFFKDKDIVVVGGGNSGVQESLYLTRFVKSIKLVEFMAQMNAEKILQKRALENEKYSFYLGHKMLEIRGEQTVQSVLVEDLKSGEKKALNADGVFIWIGMNPNSGFLKDELDLDPWGYIKTGENMGTGIPGVYAVGDVRAKSVRQITTAVSDGTIAAQSALEYLEQQEEQEG